MRLVRGTFVVIMNAAAHLTAVVVFPVRIIAVCQVVLEQRVGPHRVGGAGAVARSHAAILVAAGLNLALVGLVLVGVAGRFVERKVVSREKHAQVVLLIVVEVVEVVRLLLIAGVVGVVRARTMFVGRVEGLG